MAVIGINQPQRPQQNQRIRGESDMDKVFKALQIANTGMGIAVNFRQFRNQEQQNALIEQRLANAKVDLDIKERQLEGTPTAKEALKMRELKATRLTTDREAKAFDKFRNSPRTRGFQEAFDQSSDVLNVLSGDPSKVSPLELVAAQSKTIKSIETGIIAEGDIERWNPNPGLTNTLIRKANRAASGRPIKLDVEEYKSLATVLQRQAADNLRQHAIAIGGSAIGREFGTPEEVATNVFRVDEFLTPQGGEKNEVQFSDALIKKVMDDNQVERDEAINRLRAARLRIQARGQKNATP